MYDVPLSWAALFQNAPELPPLSGDAFVFGAAPGPVVPEHLLRNATIVTANASQLSLEEHGVAKPHITFMRSNMARGSKSDNLKLEKLRGRRTGLLVLMANKDGSYQEQVDLLAGVDYGFDELLVATFAQCGMIHNRVLDARTGFLLKKYRPSMGFQSVMFCLAMGARSIAMAGFSFRAGGWSYTTMWQDRKHLDGDRVIVERLRKRGLPVYAVEEAFAADTRLRRWTADMSAAA